MAMSLPQEREGFLTLNESKWSFSFYRSSPSETDPSFVTLVWKEGKWKTLSWVEACRTKTCRNKGKPACCVSRVSVVCFLSHRSQNRMWLTMIHFLLIRESALTKGYLRSQAGVIKWHFCGWHVSLSDGDVIQLCAEPVWLLDDAVI